MNFTLELATGSSALFVFLVRRYALRRGVIDRPNTRSSHSVPTPRGGGLGVILAFLLTLMVVTGASLALAEYCAIIGVLAVAAIGWVDDHRGASVRSRLIVHLIGAALLLPLMWALPFFFLPVWARLVWWMFWVVASINVVNFMDGIDGIIGLQTLVFGAYVAFVGERDSVGTIAGLALAGASIGFLAWNWSPALIFMGDVGSGAIGVIVVAVGGLLMRERHLDAVAAFAPLSPLFVDATLTMVSRWRTGERLSEAHRTHLYQRLANRGFGHRRVALGFSVCSLGCALLATQFPSGGIVLLLLLVVPTMIAWLLSDRLLTRVVIANGTLLDRDADSNRLPPS